MMTQTPLTSNLNLDIDVMDFVDNSMAAWEEYENSIEDNSNDNYYTSYETENKTQVISTGNQHFNYESTDISADQSDTNVENYETSIEDNDDSYYSSGIFL